MSTHAYFEFKTSYETINLFLNLKRPERFRTSFFDDCQPIDTAKFYYISGLNLYGIKNDRKIDLPMFQWIFFQYNPNKLKI